MPSSQPPGKGKRGCQKGILEERHGKKKMEWDRAGKIWRSCRKLDENGDAIEGLHLPWVKDYRHRSGFTCGRSRKQVTDYVMQTVKEIKNG